MTKKIKDLTFEQVYNYCCEEGRCCGNCPLDIVNDECNNCVRTLMQFGLDYSKYKDVEIEVEDEIHKN